MRNRDYWLSMRQSYNSIIQRQRINIAFSDLDITFGRIGKFKLKFKQKQFHIYY